MNICALSTKHGSRPTWGFADLSASGQAADLSQDGIGVYLPLQLPAGTAVRLNLKDSVLHGFVAYATPERSYFRTGIEVVQVLIGGSDFSQLLKATLKEVMPEVQLVETLPWRTSLLHRRLHPWLQ